MFDLNGWNLAAEIGSSSDGVLIPVAIRPSGYDMMITSRFFFLRGEVVAGNIELKLTVEYNKFSTRSNYALKPIKITFPKLKYCAEMTGQDCSSCTTGFHLESGACVFHKHYISS